MTAAQQVQPRSLEDYRGLLAEVFDDEVSEWVLEAERTELFPRKLLEKIGHAGVLAEKWSSGAQPDLPRHLELAFALGRLGSAGISVGVSLHDSAISVLRRFGRSDYLKDIAEQAIRGDAVLCIGASEESGGSDLQIAETEIAPYEDGYVVRGVKKFVSLSPISDHILVVARSKDHAGNNRQGNVAVVLVPTDRTTVGSRYRKLSAGPLDTAPVEIDTWVPAEALVARPGTGLAAISWGLAHERLSIAAQVAASCDRALGITLARMHSRTQFGTTLDRHQALRLRMADLQSRVDLLKFALIGIVGEGRMNLRTAAAAKVTAARLGEEVMGECLHIFGGSGYLVDETPLGRWWRDMKLARVGGGTDEILWELVAAGMKPDTTGYERMRTQLL
ncbi:acyl-CoA dehydrogenase family protein [Nocardia sp. NBC_00508]|uniref:acyl-CoA dehydrogenase family protein n=1 Tax=Nocardia sp. NBC_00508 TaxID=2975992 RepID=UPI002E822927|nr:acyl-CoA dehydrogenase family protein [Nocardia sp. NBC_00508]WUD68706.1 acyl-CoA dehydrogenase family protein [Nocardia sp. NBC_00508]